MATWSVVSRLLLAAADQVRAHDFKHSVGIWQTQPPAAGGPLFKCHGKLRGADDDRARDFHFGHKHVNELSRRMSSINHELNAT